MKIRKAELKDFSVIKDILSNAISTMNDNNIYRWDEIYPTNSILGYQKVGETNLLTK